MSDISFPLLKIHITGESRRHECMQRNNYVPDGVEFANSRCRHILGRSHGKSIAHV